MSDRQFAIGLGQELEEAVAAVLARHGLTQDGPRRMSYGGGRYAFKVEMRSAGARSSFAMYASLFGLDPSLEGKQVVLRGLTHTIEGIAPKSRRYPVLVRRNMDGKVFKVTATAAAAAR